MDRSITGFQQDDAGDWVAELSCGHNQHVRHRPPFQERPWVTTGPGREGRLGTYLACPLCDRAELPAAVRKVRSSPEWDERTVPPALLRSHRLASNTWGTILLHEGNLRFSMDSNPPFSADLAPGPAVQAIPPEVDHEVKPLGHVRFSIEFFAVDRSAKEAAGGQPPHEDLSREAGDPACWAGLVCPECGAMRDGPHHDGCSIEKA